MDRQEALNRLRGLIGQDLRAEAERHGITVWTPSVPAGMPPPISAKLNKGWAGQTLERYLGLELNSSRAPDFGSWELKLVPMKRMRGGAVAVKETMAITMIDPAEVLAREFEDSHLHEKLCRTLVAARMFESRQELRSELLSVGVFDLDRPEIYSQVRQDYELVRQTIRDQGFGALSGRMGALVQPRTKGPGHGSKSRAFYARTGFVAHILGM